MEIEDQINEIQDTEKKGKKSKSKENSKALKEPKTKKEAPQKENSSKKEKKPKKEKSNVKEDSEKKCKRGFKFCKNPNCDEMVHIHKKSCPKCGFEFEMKTTAKDQQEDIAELEKLLKKKKIKAEAAGGPGYISEGPDKQMIKKAFFRVNKK